MNYIKINADISAATFKGLSLSYQRKLALLTTLLIWLGLSYAGLSIANQYADSQSVSDIVIISLFGMAIHYFLGGDFIIYTLMKSLLTITPLSVLYRHDKAILEKAKTELFKIAQNNDLQLYLLYARVNPEIRTAANLQVIEHQKNGDLQEWTKDVRNLKKLANLVYQIHLVEQFFSEEERPS
jgi:hypothetical protein